MDIWKNRAKLQMKEVFKYSRYIFNDHSVLLLFILFGAGAVYYQTWLGQSPMDFPWELVVAVILSVPFIHNPIFTFLKRTDLIFLMPREGELGGYWKNTWLVSLGVHLYEILIVLGVLTPLIFKYGNFKWLPFMLLLIALKAWNLAIAWNNSYIYEYKRMWSMFVPFISYLVTAISIYCYLLNQWLGLGVSLIIAGLTVMWALRFSKNYSFNWEYWIAKEEKRRYFFFKIINLVTDVPDVHPEVKRRTYANVFVPKLKYIFKSPMEFIYSRTWLRSSDYFKLFSQFLIIEFIFTWIFSLQMSAVILGGIFLLLYGIQLLPLWQYHQKFLWNEFLPVEKQKWQDAFLRFVQKQLLLFSSLMVLVIFISTQSIQLFVIGYVSFICLSFLLSTVYIKPKLR